MELTTELLSKEITDFVSGLNGRYQKWVSDEYLHAHLFYEFDRTFDYWHDEPYGFRAYYVAEKVFTQILDYKCKATAKGYNEVKAFIELFKKYDQ